MFVSGHVAGLRRHTGKRGSSTDLLIKRGVAHLVVHGTSGSTSYETIPPVQLETSGGVLSTADMVVQRRDGPRRVRDNGDDSDSHWQSYHSIMHGQLTVYLSKKLCVYFVTVVEI